MPTGNFGNVYAGYAARAWACRSQRFVVGANRNDILTRFFETGAMTIGRRSSRPISPSMDIQISSNFERLLFDLYDRDGAALAAAMAAFRRSGTLEVGANALGGVRAAVRRRPARRRGDARRHRRLPQATSAS